MYWASCVALIFLSIAVVTDLKTREIPDWVSLAILAVGILDGWFGGGLACWNDRLYGLGLAAVGCTALFYLGALGGGDAKLLMALGLVVGWRPLLSILFYTAVIGGVLSYIAMRKGARDLAYAPAIALGHGLWLLFANFAPSALGMWGSAPA